MVKLSFKELCDSKLSGLCTFDNIDISLSQKRGKYQKGRLWVHETLILEVIFVTLIENSFAETNSMEGTSKIIMPQEIAGKAHFYVQHGSEATTVILPEHWEASWLLLLCLVFLLSWTNKKNTYSFILWVKAQVYKNKKRQTLTLFTDTTCVHLLKPVSIDLMIQIQF